MTKLRKKSRLSSPSFDFEEDLDAWLKGKVPCFPLIHGRFSERNFSEWNRKTCEVLREPLKNLYCRYQVRPSAVLNILADAQLSMDPTLQLFEGSPPDWARDSRKRGRAEKNIQDVIEILESLQDILPVPTHGLKRIKDFIAEFPRPNANRPRAVHLRRCAQNLAVFFAEVADNPLYEDIGEILKGAFPQWKAERDTREAVKKLIKRFGSIALNDPCLGVSLMLQNKGRSSVGAKEVFALCYSYYCGWGNEPREEKRSTERE